MTTPADEGTMAVREDAKRITQKRTYGWQGFRAEFSPCPVEPDRFYAFAINPKDERRDASFPDVDTAHNFCLAAVDPNHANHSRVWSIELREVERIERDAMASAEKIEKDDIGPYCDAFLLGYRDAEKGFRIEPVAWQEDTRQDRIFKIAYENGRDRFETYSRMDPTLRDWFFRDVGSFKDSGDAYDAMHSDCCILLSALDRFLVSGHREKTCWGDVGNLAKMRKDLAGVAGWFGLMDPIE